MTGIASGWKRFISTYLQIDKAKKHALTLIWDKDEDKIFNRLVNRVRVHPHSIKYLGKWKRVKWPTKDGVYGIRIRCANTKAWLDPPREFTFTMKDGIMITDFENDELPHLWLSDRITITNRIRKCLLTQIVPSKKDG